MPDPVELLRSARVEPECFDPDSPAARASLERILCAPPAPRHRPSMGRRVAYVSVPAAVAAGTVAAVVVPSLGGSPTAIAQAAVLSRAAAALDQPNTILSLTEQDYGTATVTCMLGGHPLTVCFGGHTSDPGSAISADPSQDPLAYSEHEWLSADASIDHTLYDNGDETVTDYASHEYQVFDAAADTLSTLTDFETAASPPGDVRSPVPEPADFSNPAYYESLYRQALAGTQQVQLVGPSTIDGQSAYELDFPILAAGTAACGGGDCTPPQHALLVYVSTQTFAPVRTEDELLNPTDRPGIPPGTSILHITDFQAQQLPDTPVNEALLAMSRHPGARQFSETQAQARDQLGSARP
ncbi:MAG TPA: hypothetical protein VHX88_14470 [Solirubrobacteraceae bacterium]|jgi:hypothetical protein|nr:hypothetical protein [Solirubrobacteraceae bacterium]